MLEVTKLSVEERSRVNELIEKAQEAMDLIKKMVHGSSWI